MQFKKLSIPLIDFRLRTSENFKPLSSTVYQIKREKNEEKGVNGEVSKEEESEDEQYEMKAVKKPEESYQRRSSRQRKVVKSMKEESSDKSDESPSSEEDNEKEDPDFDSEEEDETIRKEMKRKNKEVTKFVKKEPLSAYELMIQKNREEKMAFLQSLQMDEVKTAFSEIVRNATRKKVQPVKRKLVKVERPSILRKSSRLENVKMDFCEKTLYYNALNKAEEKQKKQGMPPEMTFKDALEEAGGFYESFKVDVAIQKESKPDVNFTIYDKTVLGKMTVSEQNIAKVTPSRRITSLAWYPSPENLIIAAGNREGQLGMWNIESGNPYVFKIHCATISHLQFNPYNQTQLISSSHDGTLRCGDMVKHQFSELYNKSDTWCTYFDVLSATTYLVGQRNGVVALVDKRTRNERCRMKYVCHKLFVRTVNIHPTDKNFFLTAGNGGFLLWDLRKLQRTPVADITHLNLSVHSAFFSPVTGNSILALSTDDSISMFDSKDLTSDFKLRAPVRMKESGKLSFKRASWLPNSDELFAVSSMLYPRIEVYDKNMFVYHYIIYENLTRMFTNAFHPTRPALAVGNTYDKVSVFV